MKRALLAVATLLAACGGVASPATSSPTPSAAPSAQPAARAGPSATPSLTPIRTYYSTVSATYTPLWLAKEAGIFEKNGLDADVRLMQNPSGTAALLANQVDIGLGGAADMLGPVTSGADLQVLATLTPTYPYVFEVPNDVKTPADLKGQQLGASQAGGSDYVAMLSMLPKLGLDPAKDVSILFVGGLTERTAVLLSGKVKGTLTSPPETLTIEKNGFHVLADLASLNLPAATSVMTTHKSFIQANRPVVQKFTDSLIEGIAREKKDKALAVQVMSKYLKLEDKTALDAAYDFYTGKILPDIPEVKPEQFKDAVDALGKSNEKIKAIDLNAITDNSFVADAAKRLKSS
jgi:NitT/TauT family transport system substrate-binding protein